MKEYLVRIKGYYHEDIYVVAESEAAAIEDAIDTAKERVNDGMVTLNYEGAILHEHTTANT